MEKKLMRLSTAIDQYLTNCRARSLSPHTIRGHAHDLREFLRYAGDRTLTDITPAVLDGFAVFLQERVSSATGRHLHPRTVNKRITVIQGFFTFLVNRRHLDYNPVQVDIRTDAVDASARTIPLGDLVATFQYVSQMCRNRERNMFIMIALADVGARRSDIARLRIRDVDLEHRQVYLRRKGRKKQVLPVSARFIWAYRRWLAKRPATDHDYVLVSTKDRAHPPLTPDAISQMFRRATEKACGHAYGPHSVRHAWISEALNQAGIAPTVAQTIAGHSELKTTAGYVAQDMDATRRAVDAMPLLRHLPSSIAPCRVEIDEEDALVVDVSGWWG
jgi:integrase/recombinase XerC